MLPYALNEWVNMQVLFRIYLTLPFQDLAVGDPGTRTRFRLG